MSILKDQIEISKAVGNGRTVSAQRGQEWAAANLNLTQIRNSNKISDLVNGYWSGAANLGAGRSEHMYPDNREFWGNGVVNYDEANGREKTIFTRIYPKGIRLANLNFPIAPVVL